MKVINSIFLKRRSKIFFGESRKYSVTNIQVVSTLIQNLKSLGYTLSPDLTDKLVFYDETKNQMKVSDFCSEIINTIKEMTGDNIVYRPMYPNFPRQVMEAEQAELFLNAFIHYLSDGTLMPRYTEAKRNPLGDVSSYKTIDYGTEEEYECIFENLLKSLTSLSEEDKSDLVTYISDYFSYKSDFNMEIPFKETACIVNSYIMSLDMPEAQKITAISYNCHTATDVLRLITYMSDGDISLAENTKYRNLKRYERRIIVALLANCKNIEEDMKKYRNRWVRIMEKINPRDNQLKVNYFVKTVFDSVYRNSFGFSFRGFFEEMIATKKYRDAVDIIKMRPGEFARSLDRLLRIVPAKDIKYVLDEFEKKSYDVGSNVLLQLRTHFENRTKDNAIRVFFPKGNTSKLYCIKNTIGKIESDVCRKVQSICDGALVNIYEKRTALNKVYVAPELSDYLVPFSERSSSPGYVRMVRGSRMDIQENTKIVRAFIHWTNMKNGNRVDIDLSASILSDNFSYKSHISYTCLRDYMARHSGDITNGHEFGSVGVAEFIDIDIQKLRETGGRYVAFQVFSYTGQKFDEIDSVSFGFMERESMHSGEIFEPSTVKQRIKLEQHSDHMIPVLFDFEEEKFIFVDMSCSPGYASCRCNNVESTLPTTLLAIKSICETIKPNIFRVCILNAIARGQITFDRDNADVIYDVNTELPMKKTIKFDSNGNEYVVEEPNNEVKIITPFMIDEIMSLI